VQGVGFRYTALQAARGFKVTGYVRNLPDSRVELVAEGAKSESKALISAIQKVMDGYIRDIKTAESPGTGEFNGFYIRH
jgi:acylphosphatase